MRMLVPILLLLAGCASNTQGKWPSLATRPGEMTSDLPGGEVTRCPGCGQDMIAPPVVPPAPEPLPANVETRLAEITAMIARTEAEAPPQAAKAVAAIEATRGNPDRSGDAEVERSRYEALFMPLSIEERRLEVLNDDVAGRDGADAVLARIAVLRDRLAALQAARVKLPD